MKVYSFAPNFYKNNTPYPFKICPEYRSKVYCILLGYIYKYLLSSRVVRLVLNGLSVCSSHSLLLLITLLLHDFPVGDKQQGMFQNLIQISPSRIFSHHQRHLMEKTRWSSLAAPPAQNIYSGLCVKSAEPDSTKAYFEQRSLLGKEPCSEVNLLQRCSLPALPHPPPLPRAVSMNGIHAIAMPAQYCKPIITSSAYFCCPH